MKKKTEQKPSLSNDDLEEIKYFFQAGQNCYFADFSRHIKTQNFFIQYEHKMSLVISLLSKILKFLNPKYLFNLNLSRLKVLFFIFIITMSFVYSFKILLYFISICLISIIFFFIVSVILRLSLISKIQKEIETYINRDDYPLIIKNYLKSFNNKHHLSFINQRFNPDSQIIHSFISWLENNYSISESIIYIPMTELHISKFKIDHNNYYFPDSNETISYDFYKEYISSLFFDHQSKMAIVLKDLKNIPIDLLPTVKNELKSIINEVNNFTTLEISKEIIDPYFIAKEREILLKSQINSNSNNSRENIVRKKL